LAEDALTAGGPRCLIARDAVFKSGLSREVALAFLAIKDCEKKLDQIERKIDDSSRSHYPRRRSQRVSCWRV